MKREQFESFKSSFPEKLRFWTMHCIINALPSYLIAVVWLELWPFAQAHWAMLAAVLTFILGYAVFTSWVSVLRAGPNLFTRALNVGLLIRTIISVITIISIPLASPLLFTPDAWSGFAASWVVSQVSGKPPLIQRISGVSDELQVSFLEIYAITVIEGLILSFLLFILSFVAIIILQNRERKKSELWRGSSNP